MEVLAVQQQYQTQYGLLGSNKVKDWSETLTPPQTPPKAKIIQTNNNINNNNNNTNMNNFNINNKQHTVVVSAPPYVQCNTTNKIKNSINKQKSKRTAAESAATNIQQNSSNNNNNNNNIVKSNTSNSIKSSDSSSSLNGTTTSSSTIKSKKAATNTSNVVGGGDQSFTTPQLNDLFYCDSNTIDIDIDTAAINELSLRLLNELRAAKSRHLTCTEVSIPCDLTPRIAAEILRVAEKEPCGLRGCTIYIEFEDEPNNSRRIATLQLDDETISTFEVYLTLRQDHRGWTALLPQFMKSLARTITISPEFTITKHKLYAPQLTSYSYNSSSSSNKITMPMPTTTTTTASAAITTPTS